jgi:hypothetical protein
MTKVTDGYKLLAPRLSFGDPQVTDCYKLGVGG